MTPLNKHRHYTVILLFLCTDLYTHLKLFDNLHFDLSANNSEI